MSGPVNVIICGAPLLRADERMRLAQWAQREYAVDEAAKRINATPLQVGGGLGRLWSLPGYPELTDNQLLQVAGELP